MQRIGFKDFAEGECREFTVGAAYGTGQTIKEDSYEYEGKINKSWEMQVAGDSGETSYLKLSPTMHRAVEPQAGKLGVGARFALTKVDKSNWTCVVTEANAAPPTPQQQTAGVAKSGAPLNSSLGLRYDKWSSAVLSKHQMEALATWATENAAAVSLGLGLDPGKHPEHGRAVQGVWSSLLIMGQSCGVPSEFGDEALPTDRDALRSRIADAALEANLPMQKVADYLCHHYRLLTAQDIGTDELSKIAADLPMFISRVAAWEQQEQP